jgi:hypothetical protein
MKANCLFVPFLPPPPPLPPFRPASLCSATLLTSPPSPLGRLQQTYWHVKDDSNKGASVDSMHHAYTNIGRLSTPTSPTTTGRPPPLVLFSRPVLFPRSPHYNNRERARQDPVSQPLPAMQPPQHAATGDSRTDGSQRLWARHHNLARPGRPASRGFSPGPSS